MGVKITIKKTISGFIFILFFSITGHAQEHFKHNAFWGRVVLSDKISKKLKWELYLQQRTQNDSIDKLNLFKHHQVTSYWVWIHYQLSKDLRVSLTPFCYFNTIGLFPQSKDVGNRGIKEYRWAAQIEQTQKLKYFNYSNRYSLEYRLRDLFEAGVFVSNYRARYRARLEKPLGKKFSVILYDEIMLEFGRAVRKSPAVFNQNRIYAGFAYDVVKNVKFNLGYMYVIQERSNGKQFDNSNVLWAILTFDNIFSQFVKQKPEVLLPN
jgi:hypothetical protein